MLQSLNNFSDIIKTFKIKEFSRFGNLNKLRAEIIFIDESVLFIRETVLGDLRRKYSYHWQDNNGKLILRWDNAPDWKNDTYPHHIHIGKENNISVSFERTLDQVLNHINDKIKKTITK
jgi:hypothetical protein